MATIPSPLRSPGPEAEIDYPTGDGKPVGETPIHRDNLLIGVKKLERHFIHEPMVYVSGNMFVYYEQGNPRKHVSPDVFVALGVRKDTPRDAYFTWREGHGLDFVVELTSKSTRDEDLHDKMTIYRDRIVVREYFLFDPKGEYLDPPLQGHRLREGKYVPIEMVGGRLPSEVIGLELEGDGEWLRYHNPATGRWLPTPDELLVQEQAMRKRAEAERERAEAERKRAEAERERLAAQLEGSSNELARLRNEVEQWRQRFGGQPDAIPPNTP